MNGFFQVQSVNCSIKVRVDPHLKTQSEGDVTFNLSGIAFVMEVRKVIREIVITNAMFKLLTKNDCQKNSIEIF